MLYYPTRAGSELYVYGQLWLSYASEHESFTRRTVNKPITFQIDSEIADAFNQASPGQRQAIQSVVNLWLKQMVQPESLEAITQEIRQEAAAQGLTPSILDDLLIDD